MKAVNGIMSKVYGKVTAVDSREHHTQCAPNNLPLWWATGKYKSRAKRHIKLQAEVFYPLYSTVTQHTTDVYLVRFAGVLNLIKKYKKQAVLLRILFFCESINLVTSTSQVDATFTS